MSHHGDIPEDSPLRDAVRKILDKPLIGATGLHPEGKLTPHDEGGIQFAVGVKDGKVVLDFGQPVVWLGMSPGDALQLAETLIQRARQAAKGSGSILTLNI